MVSVAGAVRGVWYAWLLSGASVLALAATSPAVARSQVDEVEAGAVRLAQAERIYEFDIPSKPLPRAIADFSAVTGLQVLYTETSTYDHTAPALRGAFTARQALDRLVSGSRLSYRYTSANAVTLERKVAQEDDGPIRIDPILVEGAAYQGKARGSDVDPLVPFETPGSVSVITRENMERFRGISPADFLRGTPGVMSGESRGGGGIDINIRGLQSFDRTIVRVDGTRQSSTSNRGYQGETTRTFIDPDLIGGAIISKGPSSDLQAAGAIGGLVELRTLEPDDIIKEGKDWGLRLRGGLITNTTEPPPPGTEGGINASGLFRVASTRGSSTEPVKFDESGSERLDRPGALRPTHGHGSIALARRFKNLSLIGAYSRRRIGNYFAGAQGDDGPRPLLLETFDSCDSTGCDTFERYRALGNSEYRLGEEILNTSNDSHSGLLKAQYEFVDGHDIQFGYQRYEADFGFVYASNLNGPSLNLQGDDTRVEIDTFTGRYRFNPEEIDLVDLELNLWHTNQFFDETQLAAYSSFVTTEARETERTAIELENRSRFATDIGDFTLALGASATWIGGHIDRVTPFGGGATVEIKGDLATRREYALSANLDWAPSDWLTLSAGAQRVGFEQPGQTLPLTSEDDPFVLDDVELSDSGEWSPSVRTVLEPLPGLQVFAGYAESVRPPTPTEFDRSYAAYDFFDFGLKPLGPERLRSIELGANLAHTGILDRDDVFGAKLVYFNNKVDDYIGRLAVALPPPLDWIGIPVVTNLESAEFEGIEFSAYYDHSRFFAELGATYYTQVEFCRSADIVTAPASPACRENGAGFRDYAKNHVPPRFDLTATLGARFFSEDLTLGTRVRHIGERFTTSFRQETDNGLRLSEGGLRNISWEPYTLVDLFASYRITDTASLDVNVDNLLDLYYIDPLNISGIPGPGRTIRANLTLHF